MDETSTDTDVIYVNKFCSPGGPLMWFEVSRHRVGAYAKLQPCESAEAVRGFAFFRTWIITYLGDGRAVMQPKRSKWHRWLRGDGMRAIEVS